MAAMASGKMDVAPPPLRAAPLKGVPLPAGSHMRFDEAGAGENSPARTILRGVAVSQGAHKRWM